MNVVFARVACACGWLGILLLAALHVLRPDLDPALHMVSEYAVGAHGWVMACDFLALGLGCASLLASLIPHTRSVVGRIGGVFLAAAAAGLLMAALFPTDPFGTTPEQTSFSGHMHGMAVMIGNPGFIIDALLLSLSLRRNPAWASVRVPLFALTSLTWISFAAVFYMLMSATMQQGTMTALGAIGWPNRALVVAYGGWLICSAWPQVRAVGSSVDEKTWHERRPNARVTTTSGSRSSHHPR
ncbi:MAG: hypothetical protein RL701_250 [Pseudomonadota bacterium]